MDVQEKSKKRELIKTIAIIFLVIMLLLTFFSQTIMNHSLPEVATQVVQSGTINAKIRGSGTVAANESYEVVMEQTREVRSVCVKAGDTVEEGTLLFVMGDMESQEMKDAQNALQEAELAYQKQILTFSKTYAENDLKVKNLRLDLEKAIHDRDTNKVSDTEISYAKGNLASAKTQQSQLELLLGELKAAQESSEEYTEAKSKVDELNSKIKELETAADGYREQLGELNTTGEGNHENSPDRTGHSPVRAERGSGGTERRPDHPEHRLHSLPGHLQQFDCSGARGLSRCQRERPDPAEELY